MSDQKKMYVINNNDEHNLGCHHEMHTLEHVKQLGIKSYTEVGIFGNEWEALEKARTIYPDADGCSNCCPEADTDRHHR